jgi:hypothetical protein
MGGGLMQLVAYGAQDIYLTGNPQVTFFKVVYRRHTNFSIESIEQTFNGQADFGKKVTSTISRNGDLIWKVYLQTDLPTVEKTGGTFAWTRYIGHVLLKQMDVEIGGQRIDRQYGDWLTIWNELTQTAEKFVGYNNMVGNISDLFTPDSMVEGRTLYIPLQFWFNRNPGLALPLIALQYHEVKINIEFRPVRECFITNDCTDPDAIPSLGNTSLYVDYIYLDTDERRRFAQVSHEYLIEQLQFTGDESISNISQKIRLNFNHPCKEFIWVSQLDSVVDACTNEWSNYTNQPGYSGGHLMLDAKILLNGHDRFSTRFADYFNLVQPYQHHTRIPATGIYVYSFGLKPEEHQPSGSVNMSRIDNATLQLTMTTSEPQKLRIYSVNYNVLRIMSGMGKFFGQSVFQQKTNCPSICYKLQMLVILFIIMATLSNCWKLLRVISTKVNRKLFTGLELTRVW